jgi:23S rRNA (adenine-N6)-dimethyltransferase
VTAAKRSPRDERRRRLGQNFLAAEVAEQLVEEAAFPPGSLVVEIGAGRGAVTAALARRGLEVVAVEVDPAWASELRRRFAATPGCVRVVERDFVSLRLPLRPFRVIGSLPFAHTTDVLARLLDDPGSALERADLVVQWEVARKRAAAPPRTLRSSAWAPWWTFRLGRRIPATAFRPIPRVDSGVLTIARRDPALLPHAMARDYAAFVRSRWPFDAPGSR